MVFLGEVRAETLFLCVSGELGRRRTGPGDLGGLEVGLSPVTESEEAGFVSFLVAVCLVVASGDRCLLLGCRSRRRSCLGVLDWRRLP